jgi:hypothetical protein
MIFPAGMEELAGCPLNVNHLRKLNGQARNEAGKISRKSRKFIAQAKKWVSCK